MSKFPIEIDATNKDLPFGQFLIVPASDTLIDATKIQTLMLEPGKNYQFVFQSAVLSEWTFRVDQNGKVQYDDLFDLTNGGFLTGRGTTRLTLVGYPVTFDATSLSGGGVVLGVKGQKFEWIGARTFRLLPQANYYVLQGSGSPGDFHFAVTLPSKKGNTTSKGGLFDYDPAYDVCKKPRGFLAGRGTNRLQFLGYPILVNACAAGDEPTISNIQSMRADKVPVMTFLPGAYRFSVVRGVGNEAHLDFVIDREGDVANVSFDPPSAPFMLKVGCVARPELIVAPRK